MLRIGLNLLFRDFKLHRPSFLHVGQRVIRKRKVIHEHLPVKREVEITRSVPFTCYRIISYGERIPRFKHLRVVQLGIRFEVTSRLLVLKVHPKRSSCLHHVAERHIEHPRSVQFHACAHFITIFIGRGLFHKVKGRVHRKVRILLSDIAVLKSQHHHFPVRHNTRYRIFDGVEVAVEMEQTARSTEHLYVMMELPSHEVGRHRGIAQIVVFRIDLLLYRTHVRPNHPFKDSELRLYILAVAQDEYPRQIAIVAIDTITLGLHVGRESRIGNPVKRTETGFQTIIEVGALHTVQHIHPRLSVLSRTDKNKPLSQLVLSVAHQHHLVTGHGNHITEVSNPCVYILTFHTGHFHPIILHIVPRPHLAAHQVIHLESVLVLKGKLVLQSHLFHFLHLPVACTHHHHAAHGTDFLYDEFKHRHHLPHGQSVYRHAPVPRSDGLPYLPSLTEESIHELLRTYLRHKRLGNSGKLRHIEVHHLG